MDKITLILDLDGVLITTPPWKADEIDLDGYSKFNTACVSNLNILLSQANFEIVLSSTRRILKTLEEFNRIFAHRNITQSIKGFIPVYNTYQSRKEEIERFLTDSKIHDFIILDDDKSLNGLTKNRKQYLILTEFMKGFDKDKLEEAKRILRDKFN